MPAQQTTKRRKDKTVTVRQEGERHTHTHIKDTNLLVFWPMELNITCMEIFVNPCKL